MTFEGLFTPENAVALVTLAALEIVLGIDNLVFISILTGRLPEHQRAKARRVGLVGAMVMRIVLLFSISWLMTLTKPLFLIPAWVKGESVAPGGLEISGKDIILFVGGLFLVGKATLEIHHKIEGGESPAGQHPDPKRALTKSGARAFGATVLQILLIDMVFSLDSVITAVGMAKRIEVMVAAVVLAVVVMLLAVNVVSRFVEQHPTVKMLALAFLILIGVMLTAEAFHQHIPRGYIYFAMAFSLGVEFLNLWAAKKKAKAASPAH